MRVAMTHLVDSLWEYSVESHTHTIAIVTKRQSVSTDKVVLRWFLPLLNSLIQYIVKIVKLLCLNFDLVNA